MNKIIHHYLPIIFSILLFCDVTKSDTFLDKQSSPLIIVGSFENETTLFSYALAGKSASVQTGPSKIFIGRPSSRTDVSEQPQDILQCTLRLSRMLNGTGTNELVCDSLIRPNTVLASHVCVREPTPFSEPLDRSYSSVFGSILRYENGNNQNQLLTCDFKGREPSKANTPPSPSFAVRGLCYLSDDEGKQISNLVYSQTSRGSASDLLYYALLGFSADFLGSQVVLGVPGYLNYQGSVVNINTRQSSPCAWSQSDVKGLSYYDYFGYSITSGIYFRRGVRNHAIGTPRGSMGKGQVFVVRLDNNGRMLDVISELTGDEAKDKDNSYFGSYFGSVLASTDLNGDGFDDLLVGAPMYTTTVYDEGCVFRFQSTRRSLSFPKTGERLCPSKTPGGRFGSSITPLGDINEDGLGDVAISAPFGDTGRVYIYFGVKSGPLTYIEVEPTPMKTAINGFGTTILGKVDFDGNGTPDIAIGSYLSKSISVYLTRPRITLSVRFDSSQPTKFKPGDAEFILSPLICAENKLRKPLPTELRVWVKVVADSQVAPDKRRFVVFAGSDSVEKQHVVEFRLTLQRNPNGMLCERPLVTVRNHTVKPDDQEKIVFDWKVWYNETSKELNSTEIININSFGQSIRSGNSKQEGFCSLCPAPTEEFSTNNTIELSDRCGDDGNPECNPELDIAVKFMDETERELEDSIIIGNIAIVNVIIIMKNKRETAYVSAVNVILTSDSDSISVEKLFRLHLDLCVSQNHNSNQSLEVSCTRAFTIHKDQEVKLTGVFNLKDLRAQPKPVKIGLQLKVPTQGKIPTFFSEEETLLLKSKVNLDLLPIEANEGHVSDGETTDFVHKFKVTNAEISTPSSVELQFKFPYKFVKEKKAILTLLSISSPTGIVNCNNSAQTPLQLASTSSRQKRNVKESTPSDSIVSQRAPSIGSSAVWRCEEPNWICETLECKGYFPENNLKEFEILMNYRIDSFLARKLKLINSELMKLEVRTSGLLKQFGSDDKLIKVASQTFIIAAVNGGPTAIQLIAAGGIGLILLFVIVAGLFKCGFFRRKTKEELQALKARTEDEENLAKTFPVRDRSKIEDDNDEI